MLDRVRSVVWEGDCAPPYIGGVPYLTHDVFRGNRYGKEDSLNPR